MFALSSKFFESTPKATLIRLDKLLRQDAKLNLFGTHGLFCAEACNNSIGNYSSFDHKLFDSKNNNSINAQDAKWLDIELMRLLAKLTSRFARNNIVNPLIDYNETLAITKITLTPEQQTNLQQWCQGYLLGLDSKTHTTELLMPIVTLAQTAITDTEQLTSLLAQIPNILARVYVQSRTFADDLCHCGSEKYFKKCCEGKVADDYYERIVLRHDYLVIMLSQL